MSTILVTGATSGFGKAIAERFSAEGWNCIITGRRKDRLESVAAELSDKHDVDILALDFDVQDRKAVFDHLSRLPERWQGIDVLVNNAGLALGKENFDRANIDDWDTMIDTNVKGLLYVSKAVIPYFIRNQKGHIINIGSTAAKDVYPGGNVYCAAKHAVNAISQSQRIELLDYKIKVTAIHPGAAQTEFSNVRFKGDQAKADAVYEGFEPLHAPDIAEIVYYCATLPWHVCVNDLVVTCTAQANSFFTKRG